MKRALAAADAADSGRIYATSAANRRNKSLDATTTSTTTTTSASSTSAPLQVVISTALASSSAPGVAATTQRLSNAGEGAAAAATGSAAAASRSVSSVSSSSVSSSAVSIERPAAAASASGVPVVPVEEHHDENADVDADDSELGGGDATGSGDEAGAAAGSGDHGAPAKKIKSAWSASKKLIELTTAAAAASAKIRSDAAKSTAASRLPVATTGIVPGHNLKERSLTPSSWTKSVSITQDCLVLGSQAFKPHAAETPSSSSSSSSSASLSPPPSLASPARASNSLVKPDNLSEWGLKTGARSDVWRWALVNRRTPTLAMCPACRTVFQLSGGTSSLTTHVSRCLQSDKRAFFRVCFE